MRLVDGYRFDGKRRRLPEVMPEIIACQPLPPEVIPSRRNGEKLCQHLATVHAAEHRLVRVDVVSCGLVFDKDALIGLAHQAAVQEDSGEHAYWGYCHEEGHPTGCRTFTIAQTVQDGLDAELEALTAITNTSRQEVGQ